MSADAPSRCPVCGRAAMRFWRYASASDPELAGRAGYSLERCAACGSARTIGSAAEPRAMYEGGTYAESRSSLEPLLASLRRLADRDRARLVASLPRTGRVLELGAGDGALVARMRAGGIDAWGIDPSPAACAAAARAGIEVRQAAIETAEIEPSSQDGIVIWHALEHVERPREAIGRVAGWIRPGGTLVVAVPNLAGLQARLGGDRWFHQDVPRHRTHFTPAGVRALLERGGFRVDRVRHLLIEQNPLGMWQTLLNWLTRERDFAFRLLKRDLAGVAAPDRARDLVVTAIAAAPAAAIAVPAELAAGLARRGGSIVVEATANQ